MRIIKNLSMLLAVLGGLFTLGMMIYTGQGWKQGADWWIGFAALGLGNLVPYAGLIGCALLARRRARQAVAVLIGTMLLVGLSIILLVHGFIVDPKEQNLLLFIIMPAGQLVWVGILLIVTLVLGISRGAGRPSSDAKAQ
ncbi:MAG: hypothetical protein AB1696_10520 [Planctomycetota bacterium]